MLNQSYSCWEVLLINDGSTDHTEELARAFSKQDARVRVFTLPSRCGAAFARNFGVQKAAFSWIAFLDSDDLWMPEKLEVQAAYLDAHPEADLCYTGAIYFRSTVSDGAEVPAPEQITLSKLLRRNEIPCSSVVVRASCLWDVPMEEGLVHEDYLLWLRLAAAGKNLQGVNRPLTCHRLHRDSRSGSKTASAQMTYRTYRQFGRTRLQAVGQMVLWAVHGVRKYAAMERPFAGRKRKGNCAH